LVMRELFLNRMLQKL